jgi:hypothetical protein
MADVVLNEPDPDIGVYGVYGNTCAHCWRPCDVRKAVQAKPDTFYHIKCAEAVTKGSVTKGSPPTPFQIKRWL